MNKLDVFVFDSKRVRIAGTAERPLFCAADVCSVLGIADAADACKKLDQDELEAIRVQPGKGGKPATFVTEPGLYRLIFSSRKPQARAFQKWVYSEVLPEIRQRGAYSLFEAARKQEAKRLLEECFPHLPGPAKPMFGTLIESLLVVRREHDGRKNPPWGRGLAGNIYRWSIKVDGQQQYRRRRNPNPNGSSLDHSMFDEKTRHSVEHVVNVGNAFAKLPGMTWELWNTQMEFVFGTKAIQAPLMVPLLWSPDGHDSRKR